MRNFFNMAISELYKAGKVKEDQLGVLAKAVICAKLGCSTSGQEVVFGSHVLRLTDSLPPHTQKPQVQQSRPSAAGASARGERPVAEPKRDVHSAQKSKQERSAATTVRDRGTLIGGATKAGAAAEGCAVQPAAQRPAADQKLQSGAKAQPLFPPKAQQDREAAAPPTTAQKHAPSSVQSATRQEPPLIVDRQRLEELARLVAREAKIDVTNALTVLSSIVNYLSAYPSVGILRLIDDIAKKTKANQRVVKVAIEALRGIDVVEIVNNAVVNLKTRKR